MSDRDNFIYLEPWEVRTEVKVRVDNVFILLRGKGNQKDKVTSIMLWKSQDQNPGLSSSGALFSLWPSPTFSVTLFCSSHGTERSAHESVVT